MKGDRVEIVVDAGATTRTYEVMASKAGRKVKITTQGDTVEVSELTRGGTVVRAARFMAARVVALVECPAGRARRTGARGPTRAPSGKPQGPNAPISTQGSSPARAASSYGRPYKRYAGMTSPPAAAPSVGSKRRAYHSSPEVRRPSLPNSTTWDTAGAQQGPSTSGEQRWRSKGHGQSVRPAGHTERRPRTPSDSRRTRATRWSPWRWYCRSRCSSPCSSAAGMPSSHKRRPWSACWGAERSGPGRAARVGYASRP